MIDINVCFATNKSYVKYMAATMISILINSKPNENVIFHVLISNDDLCLEDENRLLSIKSIKNCDIKFYNPDINKCIPYSKKIRKGKFWPLSAFYRLQIPSLIKDVDRLLYLDCDMIVNTSLSELFTMDISNYYAVVTNSVFGEEIIRLKKRLGFNEKDFYFCSGFLLINNKLFIESNLESQFISCSEKLNELFYADEDILNLALKDKVKILEDKWAYVAIKHFYDEPSPIKDIKIIHYGGPNAKPWEENSVETYHIIEWWKYFTLTEWYKESPIEYINILINLNIKKYVYNNLNFDNIQKRLSILENNNYYFYTKFSIGDFIFSIKENNDYKIITLFGIKITIKK